MPELRWDYERDLAVLRELELKKHHDWRRGTKRLQKVYGPPGVGKSWFLGQVSEGLPSDAKNWCFIDARDAQGAATPAELADFTKTLVQKLQEKCTVVPNYEPMPTPTALLQQVVEVLCQECASNEPFLFVVDQCDNLLGETWHNFERTILNSLAWMDCTRFVVAMREEQHISIPALRYSYELLKLSPFNSSANHKDEHQGDEQLMKLAKNHLGVESIDDQVKAWMKGLKASFPEVYSWRHPTLNLFLFEQHWNLHAPHLQEPPTIPLLKANPDLLREGLTALTPLPGDLSKLSTLALIRKLAEQESWSFSELETDTDLSRVADIWRLQLYPLLEKGFTVVEGSSYRLADGVYEFVKACI